MNIQHTRSQSSTSLSSMDVTLAESSRSVIPSRSTSSASLTSFDCTIAEPGSRVSVRGPSGNAIQDSMQQLSSSPKALHRRLSSSNTVVSAMLSSNNLRSCSQAGDMVSQCMFNSDNDSSALCKTAQQYLNGCIK